MPEDLKKQMPLIEEMAAAFGWPLLRAENYEADDLIGAFASRISGKVFIVTGDKDLSSLVTENVHLLKPARSGGGFQECGTAEVIEDFGVENLGDNAVADTHLNVSFDCTAGKNCSVFGFNSPDFNIRILCLESFADTCYCATRANA